MANESAVADIARLPSTTTTCDGCGEALETMKDHLLVQVKTQRNSIISVNAADVDSREAKRLLKDEEAGAEMYYIGTKSGAGEMWLVHDWECLLKKARTTKTNELKLKLHIGDPPDAETDEGSDE